MFKFLKKFIVVAITVTLFTTTAYAATNSSEVVDVLQKLPYLRDLIEQFSFLDGSFSEELFNIVRVFIEFIFGIVIISAGKNFAVQGVAVVYYDIKKMILYGLTFYIIAIMLAIIFLTSFVGIPISIIIVFLMYIIVCMGKVSFVVFMGYIIEKSLNQQWHIYIDYIVGGVILEAVGLIPYIGKVFILFIFPAISVGIFLVGRVNKLMGVYYNVPLRSSFDEKKYDRETIRNIITKDI